MFLGLYFNVSFARIPDRASVLRFGARSNDISPSPILFPYHKLCSMIVRITGGRLGHPWMNGNARQLSFSATFFTIS
jgi:hypothetical protein